MELSRSTRTLTLFRAAAGEGSRQVADQDNIVNRADDTVGDLEAFVIFQLERAGH